MRRVGQSRKRDTAEKPIVTALRAIGASVIRISEPGAPDLIVFYRGALYLLEVKQAKARGMTAGTLTPRQVQLSEQGWPVRIVRTEREALEAVGAGGIGC